MKVCLFSSYSESSILANYVKVYLENLRPFFDRLIFITNSRDISQKDLSFIKSLDVKLVLVDNHGHDFGMYYQVLKKVELSNLLEICLVNDSCIPIKKLDGYFKWFRKSKLDFSGFTDCHKTCYYIQSYFLTAKNRATSLLIEFILANGIQSHFSDVVKVYERGLTTFLISQNCKVGPLYDSKKYSGEYIELDNAEELIKDGFPLIKKKLLTKKLRHFQRYRLEKLGYNLDYDYKKFLKGKIANLDWLLEGIHGNEELERSPKVSIIIDSSRSNNIILTDHYSYKNYDIISADKLNSKNSLEKINSEYFLFLGNNNDLLPNSLYKFISNAINTDYDLIYSNEMIIKDGNVVKFFVKPKPDSLTFNSDISESFLVTNSLLKEVSARTMSEFRVKLLETAKRKFHIADYLIKTTNTEYYSAFKTELHSQPPFGWSNKFSAPAGSEDLLSAGIDNLKCKISSFNNPNIALFGAGQHTERLLKSKELPDLKVSVIFDDSPKVKSISGIDVKHSSSINAKLIDLIVVSSDTIEDMLVEKLLKKSLKNVTIMSIYSDIKINL